MNKPPEALAHEAFIAFHRSTGSVPGPWNSTLAGHWSAAAEAASAEARCGEFHRGALAWLAMLGSVLPDGEARGVLLSAAEDLTAECARVLRGGTIQGPLKAALKPLPEIETKAL